MPAWHQSLRISQCAQLLSHCSSPQVCFRTEFYHVAPATLELLPLKTTGTHWVGAQENFHIKLQPYFHMSLLGYGGHSLDCNLDKEDHIALALRA